MPNIQLLLESDPCWWSYDALKCGYLDVVMFRVAHWPKWLIGQSGSSDAGARYRVGTANEPGQPMSHLIPNDHKQK
jgi:hypothetical protein